MTHRPRSRPSTSHRVPLALRRAGRAALRWAASKAGRRALRVIAVFVLMYPLTSGESLPVHRGDLCALFAEKPEWYRAMNTSAERWGVSVGLQMAVMKHESDFYSKARPPRRRLWGLLPWKRPSTAYGYGQVLDATWSDFRQRQGQSGARRDRFSDVAGFMGWYLHRLHHATGVAKDDAYGLYLAYHEGPGGYARGSYESKTWLQRTARQVAEQSRRFQTQLATCDGSLRRRHLITTAIFWLALLLLATWIWRREWRRRVG